MTTRNLLTLGALAAFGLAAPAAHAQTLTLNTGDTLTVNGSGTAGHIGATVYTPPNAMTTITGGNDPYLVETNGTSAFTLGAGGALNSTLNANGATVQATGSGPIMVTGGTITAGAGGTALLTSGGSPVTVSGGSVTAGTNGEAVATSGSGVVTITGGVFTGGLYTLVNVGIGSIDLYGDFGKSIGMNQIITGNGTSGSFFGTLQNNTLGQTFTYYTKGTITLHNVALTPAPEPSQTAVLALGTLALSSLILRARKSKKATS